MLTSPSRGALSRAVAAAFAFLVAVAAYATIGTGLQMQTGNPSSATADASNHAHFLVDRAQYVMDYNDTTHEPNWVSWDLTSGDVGSSGRSNFIVDTTLPAGFYQVLTTDYSGSGYDRGHMCPSADRTVTAADNQIVFYMSNMVPQTPDNNQGVWASFETYCRTLASAGNEVLIMCGPSGFSGSTIASGVAIPGYTWKIAVVVPLGAGSALDRITSSTRVITIKVPNIAGVRSTPWQNFVTSVTQIQNDTGFTFFTALPAAIADPLRAVVDGQSAAGAPSITSQPSSQTTIVGGTATFSVAATGDAPLSYQWLKDEAEIPGATSSTLNLFNVQASDAGSYVAVVTNPVGSTTSSSASLIITGIPPSISTPPASQTVGDGSSVTFSVLAAGSPTLTYQWRKDTSPILGANSATYHLPAVQPGDAGSYDVVVTNSVTSVTSPPATLTVNAAAPTITGQPVSKSVTTGGNASFTVVAIGTAPLTYQWRKDGAPLTDGGVISGATTATLLLTGVSAVDGGSFDVIVTNALGSAPSSAATLTINPPPPSTVYWNFGATSASADPTSGLTADLLGGTMTQGNNNGTTTLVTNVSVSSGYSGVSGSFNAGAAARIGALNQAAGGSAYFEFTLAPSATKRLLATGISFGMRSTGTGPQAFGVYTSLDGYTTAVASGTVPNNSNWNLYTPTFTNVTGAAGSPITFRIYGYNGVGSAGVNTANWRIDDLKLTINAIFPPPVPPVVLSTTPVAGAVDVDATLPISITFNEPVSFTGSFFSISSAASGLVSATVTGDGTTFQLTPPSSLPFNDTITVTLSLPQVVDQATGTIHGSGTTVFSFATAVFVPPIQPTVTTQPTPQTVTAGSNVNFAVAASGTAPLSFQWRKNSVNIVGNASATTATLALINVAPTDAGSYDCVVSNIAGSDVSHAAALVVNIVPPTITTQPIAKSVASGGTASFSVVAGGTAPFGYQWRKDGIPLSNGGTVSGATLPTLTLTGVTASDSGLYDVIVTNSADSVTSNAASLAVVAVAPSTIYWDFATASPTSGIPANVTGGTLTQGNNNGTTALITTVSASSGYAGVSGTNNAGAAARVGALNKAASGSAYFEFTFTPAAGLRFAATGMAFGTRSTGTGPQAFVVLTSVDNFTTPVASGTISNDSVWRLLTPSFSGVTSLPGAAVTFRIYGYNGAGNAASGTANWRIDDLQLTAGVLSLPGIVTVGSVTVPYDGTPKSASAGTSPAGLAVNLTYNGSAIPPKNPGTYSVVGTIADANYSGTGTGTETITITALVRHAPVVNGAIDGSVQMLSGENVSLSGAAWISGDLLAPGTPDVFQSGTPTYGGTLDGTGAVLPSGYTITLNDTSLLRHVVRRTDPIALPGVDAPPTPTGTRSVSLTSPSQSAGDFATVRNLSLNSVAGPVVVPAGTYGSFTAAGNSSFVLGVAGATVPSVYNFQSLSINALPGIAQLQIVGPVIVTLANGSLMNGATGALAHPEWLTLKVAAGNLTISGNVTFNGNVVAPNATLTLNGNATLNGTVISDHLAINGTSVLNDPNQ